MVTGDRDVKTEKELLQIWEMLTGKVASIDSKRTNRIIAHSPTREIWVTLVISSEAREDKEGEA